MIQKIIDLWDKPEESINQGRRPILTTAPRRFGKTTVLDMFECFFGGGVSRDVFMKLCIGTENVAFKWYDQFCVVYITFGYCKDIVRCRDDCIDSCRLILHNSFRMYECILNHLLDVDRAAFLEWMDEKNYQKKTETDVLNGIRFLIDCVFHYGGKPVFLLIDEFDNICSNAIYKTSSEDLVEIIEFYSKVVANAVKHDTKCSAVVMSGITPITCQGHSSLNNPICINFLSNDTFFVFYGITEKEFDSIMTRDNIPKKAKDRKELARTWYNGYCYKNTNIFNTYSVVNFIQTQEVQFYWKRSGLAKGLLEAMQQESIRNEINNKLLDNVPLDLIFQDLRPENFTLIKDGRYEVLYPNFVFNFLLQQGYLTRIGDVQNEKVKVKIPNLEVKKEFTEILAIYYTKTFNFDPGNLQKCSKLFEEMNLLNKNDCETNLKMFKVLLTDMLNSEDTINEAWLECFLFTIFYQSSKIQPQIKVEETAKKGDMRTAKVLDLFITMDSKCFVIEETLIGSGEEALEKLIEKKYYKKVDGRGLPYMLIGMGLQKTTQGHVDITMSCLINKIKGKKITV
jgi:hypothetical protein